MVFLIEEGGKKGQEFAKFDKIEVKAEFVRLSGVRDILDCRS